MGLEGEEGDAFEQVADSYNLIKKDYQLTLTGGQRQGQGGGEALQGVRHREDSGCQRYIFSFWNIFNDSLWSSDMKEEEREVLEAELSSLRHHLREAEAAIAVSERYL